MSTNCNNEPLPLPLNWDRCQAYNKTKRRYCRQMIRPDVPKDYGKIYGSNAKPIYCGNHFHRYDEEIPSCARVCSTSLQSKKSKVSMQEEGRKRKNRGRRIPCPIDPSHTIYESQLKSHIQKCPKALIAKEEQSKAYFCANINKGGCGLLKTPDEKRQRVVNAVLDDKLQQTNEWKIEQFQEFALAILETYAKIFLKVDLSCESSCSTPPTNSEKRNYLKALTADDLYNGIPLEDFSDSERERGMEKDLKNNRIKMGGSKHIQQIGSILGHIRKSGLLDSSDIRVVLEVGAGRGTTGFVVASAFGTAITKSASETGHIRLIMVEKSGSRAKVDTAVRRSKNKIGCEQQESNLTVENVSMARIRGDLAHIHLPLALENNKDEKTINRKGEEDIIVIAKHLCGAGTDLALKSIKSISNRVKACVLATCCHGLCTWEDYIGRDYLRDIITNTSSVKSFDCKEFNLMKRWSVGTVSSTECGASEHSKTLLSDEEINQALDGYSVTKIVRSLNLKCGANGLGRACQRLIDYGRCQYMKEHLRKPDKNTTVVNMCHYVDSKVTPQNALLKLLNL